MAKEFEQDYLVGFGGGELYLINRDTLVPILSLGISLDGAVSLYENTEASEKDRRVTDRLSRRFNTAIYSQVMAFDTESNQIILGEEAVRHLEGTEVTELKSDKPEFLN